MGRVACANRAEDSATRRKHPSTGGQQTVRLQPRCSHAGGLVPALASALARRHVLPPPALIVRQQ